MLLREEDSGLFKQWLLPKLESYSSLAEHEVLADYVVALVTANGSDAEIKRSCNESLADFLQEGTEPFVDVVIDALKRKLYLGSIQTPAPIPTFTSFEDGPPADAPTGPAALRVATAQAQALGFDSSTRSSKKRKASAREGIDSWSGHDPQFGYQDGASRQATQTSRKSGKNPRGGNIGFEPQNGLAVGLPPNAQSYLAPPMPPPGVPPFDPNNPMAMMAMMAASGAFPNLRLPGTQQPKEPCSDYHEKGFCSAGYLCLYQHEDSTNSTLAVPENGPDQSVSGLNRSNGDVSETKRAKNSRNRASFSMVGPSNDITNTTLVIERIPKSNQNEDDVSEFFSQYGSLVDVKIHPNRRLAVVKYEDRDAAVSAYMSPKPIFNNRFVKVYWHVPQELPLEEFEPEAPLDMEAFAKRNAEAQKAHKEREEKKQSRAAIERRLIEIEIEMNKVKIAMAEVNAGKSNEELGPALLALFNEAEDLAEKMNDSIAEGQESVSREGHSGSFNPPQERKNTQTGRYPGRGGTFGASRGGRSNIFKLDNRPKRVAVHDIPMGSQKEESLRQFLLNMPECYSINRYEDTLILSFSERYQAEQFIDQSRDIPDMSGPLKLMWVENGSAIEAATATAGSPRSDGDSSATVDELDAGPEIKMEDADMDVAADDDDRWI